MIIVVNSSKELQYLAPIHDLALDLGVASSDVRVVRISSSEDQNNRNVIDPRDVVLGVKPESVPVLLDSKQVLATLSRSRGTNLVVVTSLCKDSFIVKGAYEDVCKFLRGEEVYVSDVKSIAMYPTSLESETAVDDYVSIKTIVKSAGNHKRLLDYLAMDKVNVKSGGELSEMISLLTDVPLESVDTVLSMLSPVLASLLLDKWEISDGGDLVDQIIEVGDLGYSFFDGESVSITTRLGGSKLSDIKYLRSLDLKARQFLMTKIAREMLESTIDK
jgi:hypothetical protein